ncbi:uncharacterized protein Z518_10153 [Rhinocladiella mackenziei CBS 650.93]|uniref:Transcription factor domain-containing protein n=1 Tax=Rhinocladiella mackenziei CBS 650.93 TaxID=1442369 RepID=A0A0D2FGH1_9EURO|nr:uncharacterized protein Z518_10153 [Rhinocladiella mackenziei CBS 650.93]KIX01087.1 hypothetical protein Z518_10153 [Rhinocladiella mackenziei CBS 650.93]
MMIQRWSRPPLSCRPCREKKRRDIQCEYGRQGQSEEHPGERGIIQATSTTIGSSQTAAALSTTRSTPSPEPAPCDAKEMIDRIRKLEEEVFNKPNTTVPLTSVAAGIRPEHSTRNGNSGTITRARSLLLPDGTPFGSHRLSTSSDDSSQDRARVAHLVAQLPPLGQARELFDHFSLALHPTFVVLHLPSTRVLMEETYHSIVQGDDEPCIAKLLMLFTIFAGAALTWTSQILERLRSTPEEAKAAFTAYTRLAISILDNVHRPIAPSTIALAAITTLAHVVANADGFPVKVHWLRSRCLSMARMMQIDRLDMVTSREERRLKGCDMIEIEVQRRIWWHMVASDWLDAFSGGPQEGAYIFQPRHMNVNYPSNADDESITSTGVEHELPLSAPTSMSAFIQRVKLADLCREIVDTMPSMFLESQEPAYGVVLALDDKLQTYLKQLPVFFQLDPISIQESRSICKERPHIAWQRLGVHVSLHARLCRLHRPYHLRGSTDPKYAYSRATCVRSAHTILELRRSMDDMAPLAGVRPARFWVIMHHVFMAALTLATDVSFNPDAPEAEAQKAKVMVAYQMLERSREESSALMEGIQKNMQILIATLQKRRTQMPSPQLEELRGTRNGTQVAPEDMVSNYQASREPDSLPLVESDKTGLNNPIPAGAGTQRSRYLDGAIGDQENLDQLQSEFLAAASDLDSFQWTSVLDDTDLSFRARRFLVEAQDLLDKGIGR